MATVVALHAMKSPFIESDAPIEPDSLLIALKICAHGVPFTFPSFKPKARDRWNGWKMKRDQVFFVEQCLRFKAYVDDHCSVPEFWEDDTDSEKPKKKLSAPWALSRVAQLLTQTTLTHREAWTLPLGYAFWLAGAVSEIRGSEVRFFDESQVEGLSHGEN